MLFETEGNKLKLSLKENANIGADSEYTFICKEFGVFGQKEGVSAKVSVIFCDDCMLVTLMDGSLILNFNGDLVQPIVGAKVREKVSPSEICWLNADTIKSCINSSSRKYVNRFVQDFEYVFNIKGEIGTYTLKFLSDEFADMSRGYTAELERQEKLQEDNKKVQSMMNAFVNKGGASDELDFEDEDDEEDDFDDDLNLEDVDDDDDYDDEDDYLE